LLITNISFPAYTHSEYTIGVARGARQGRHERDKGDTIPRAPHHCGASNYCVGRRMTVRGTEKSQQCLKYFNTINLLQKEFRFEHGAPNLLLDSSREPSNPLRGYALGPRGTTSQISSIPCRFTLWEAAYQTKYCCSLEVKVFGPSQYFGLATLLEDTVQIMEIMLKCA